MGVHAERKVIIDYGEWRRVFAFFGGFGVGVLLDRQLPAVEVDGLAFRYVVEHFADGLVRVPGSRQF